MARQTITRKEVDIDKCFPDDIDQYYQIATDYLNLQTENPAGAFELSKKAWVLADRWSAIQANAGKLATMNGLSKTELKDYAYQKYRQMQLLHEHCRMVWRSGEDAIRREGTR